MSRRVAREIAMQLIYQLQIQKDDSEKQISAVLEERGATKKDEEYIVDIVRGVFDKKGFIDALLEKHSKGWKVSRFSKVDLSIFRLSIYEMLFRDDIPFSVSINEAVELAKKFSTEESGAFINGILSKINDYRISSVKNNAAQDISGELLDGTHISSETDVMREKE